MSGVLDETCYFQDWLPAELKQIIFKFLDVTDILNLSLTSKSMNEIIGQSHDCMNKMWIKFYPFKPKDFDSLALSSRSYEKLKVNRVKSSSHLTFIIELHQAWRKVLIYNTEFINAEFYLNFINSFSQSIEELEVSDIMILNVIEDEEVLPLFFPNLKRIMFRNVVLKAMEGFLGHNKRLENASFDIVHAADGKKNLDELILGFLRNNPSLIHLQLGPHYIKSLFNRQEDLPMNFKFKLSKLMLKFPIVHDPEHDSLAKYEQNVCNFISQQTQVDWILLFELRYESILNTLWNKMPSIKHVTLISLGGLCDYLELSIEPNEKIEQLDVLSRKPVLISQLRKLLPAAPCLKVIHVNLLNRFILEFISSNAHSLKELRYEIIEEGVEEALEVIEATGNKTFILKKGSFWADESNPFSIDPKFWRS